MPDATPLTPRPRAKLLAVLAAFAAFAAFAAAGSLLSACGDDGDPCAYAVCDIAESDCVERVATAVGCHLEQDVVHPKVRRMTAAEYLAESEAEATPQTADEMRDYADYLRMQALVGLMPKGYEPEDAGEDYLSNFVAFYSPSAKEILMLTDRGGGDPQSDYLILVHEMVHAYQDAAWDLRTFQEKYGQTSDRSYGSRALVEGDAVLYQNLAFVELDGNDPQNIDWVQYFSTWQDESLQRARMSKTPALDMPALFPYSFGGEFALQAWQNSGAAGIAELFATPPDSVRQVLGGFAAWPNLYRNGDVAFDPRAIAVLPANYELVGGAHEGVWAINSMLQRTANGGLLADEINYIAADYLATWRRGDNDVVAMWKIQSSQPGGLVSMLTGSGADWTLAGTDPSRYIVERVDDDVVLIAVTSGDANIELGEIMGWQSPEEAYPAEDAGAIRRPAGFDARHLACAAHPR